MMTTSRRPEAKASPGFVRLIGLFELIGGTIVWYTGANWYLDGIIPARWFGIFLMGFGAVVLIAKK